MVEELKGAFAVSLQRNNKQIREDRAISISEDAELIYKRTIEDLKMQIKKIKREREGLLDLSPTNTQTLILASDFNPEEFCKKDIDLGVKIRTLTIQLEIAEERYNYLFKA